MPKRSAWTAAHLESLVTISKPSKRMSARTVRLGRFAATADSLRVACQLNFTLIEAGVLEGWLARKEQEGTWP